jgi:hypothetical protein
MASSKNQVAKSKSQVANGNLSSNWQVACSKWQGANDK